MKYLLITALVSILFLLVYFRLRPYLQFIHKVVSVLNGGSMAGSSSTTTQKRAQGENRLIRCSGCGTWIPADRALNLSSGLAAYCSRDCLEKGSTPKARKLAG